MSKKSIVDRGETQVLDAEARSTAPGQFIALADGMVHYEIAGPPQAQTVILVPGFSVPYAIWNPTFEALVNAGFRVLRYDLYGRGYSDRPDTIYHQDLFDRQILNLLDGLKINKPVDLVGLSLGGAISVVFTDRHPELVRKLCLIDPAGLPWKQSLAVKLSKAPVLGDLIMAFLGNKVLISNLRDYFFSDQKYDTLMQAFLEQMQYVGFKRALLSTLRAGVTTGALGAYENLSKRGVPVLLLWGREDQVVPFELSKRVIELNPGLEFHGIDNAAHIPHYECPEVVNPFLIDFLAG